MLYFAYGSNMNLDRMKSRKTDFEFRTAATLHGYELKFNKRAGFSRGSYAASMYPSVNKLKTKKTLWSSSTNYPSTGIKKKATHRDADEGYANVVECENGMVQGALYVVPEEGIKKLDTHEGYPTHYGRDILTVKCANGIEVEAIVYIADISKIEDNLLPSDTYLGHLLKGVDVMTDEYFQTLAKQATISEFSNSGYGSAWEDYDYTRGTYSKGATSTTTNTIPSRNTITGKHYGDEHLTNPFDEDDYWAREEENELAMRGGR